MNRKIKNIVSIILSLAIMLIPMAVFADNSKVTDPSEMFVEVCNNFFTNPIKYKAINKAGADVSDEFYAEYVNDYANGNYKALYNAFKGELSQIQWENETENTQRNLPTRMLLYLTTSNGAYALGTSTRGFAFEMLYIVHGDYTVNDSTGKIIDFSTYLEVVFSHGAALDAEEVNVHLNPTLSANAESITFNATFDVDFSLLDPWKGFPLWTESFGPYSISATGHA